MIVFPYIYIYYFILYYKLHLNLLFDNLISDPRIMFLHVMMRMYNFLNRVLFHNIMIFTQFKKKKNLFILYVVEIHLIFFFLRNNLFESCLNFFRYLLVIFDNFYKFNNFICILTIIKLILTSSWFNLVWL